jgi:hypothetical protein
MEEKLKLITSKKELEGTCYIELLPGKFDNSRFWSEESVFLEEEPIGFIEPIIIKHFSEYDHFGFQDIAFEEWHLIIKDLELLQAETAKYNKDYIKNTCGFMFNSSEHDFFSDFRGNCDLLNQLLLDLISWLKKTLDEYNQIAILGI